jgi:hypothetical protein
MQTPTRRQVTAAVGVSLALIWLGRPSSAQDAPLPLKWADLMPAAPPKPAVKSFFAGRANAPPIDPLNPTHEQSVPEGRWMSGGKKQLSEPVPVVESLNGKLVQIGGYVVPLDFDATSVKEFLLVPFVGACIHVPPPPANQLVFVQAAKGVAIKGLFAPVTVIGRMSTQPSFTGLADAGYTLAAERVEARRE